MFENYAPGAASSLADGARLECSICWWVYEPAEGDALSEVPPGTPFAHLPEHWRCPQCDGPRESFLVLRDDS